MTPVHNNDKDNQCFNHSCWFEDGSEPSDWNEYYTPSLITKSLQPLNTGCNNTSKMMHRSGAEPAPQGKMFGTRWIIHYKEIKDNFVKCLMGSGTFGWTPLLRKDKPSYQSDHIRGDTVHPICSGIMDDCWVDSPESNQTLPFIQMTTRVTKLPRTLECLWNLSQEITGDGSKDTSQG